MSDHCNPVRVDMKLFGTLGTDPIVSIPDILQNVDQFCFRSKTIVYGNYGKTRFQISLQMTGSHVVAAAKDQCATVNPENDRPDEAIFRAVDISLDRTTGRCFVCVGRFEGR